MKPAVTQDDFATTLACHECDLLVSLPDLKYGQIATCPRCDHVLTKRLLGANNRTLALATSALIFLIFSLTFPFLSFSSQDKEYVISFADNILNMVFLDFFSLAILLLFTTLVFPGVCLLALIYVLISLKCKSLLPQTQNCLHLVFILINWNMAEIFLVAILVSFIKIASLATVSLGLSFWSYSLFIICLVACLSLLDQYQIWQKVKQHA